MAEERDKKCWDLKFSNSSDSFLNDTVFLSVMQYHVALLSLFSLEPLEGRFFKNTQFGTTALFSIAPRRLWVRVKAVNLEIFHAL